MNINDLPPNPNNPDETLTAIDPEDGRKLSQKEIEERKSDDIDWMSQDGTTYVIYDPDGNYYSYETNTAFNGGDVKAGSIKEYSEEDENWIDEGYESGVDDEPQAGPTFPRGVLNAEGMPDGWNVSVNKKTIDPKDIGDYRPEELIFTNAHDSTNVISYNKETKVWEQKKGNETLYYDPRVENDKDAYAKLGGDPSGWNNKAYYEKYQAGTPPGTPRQGWKSISHLPGGAEPSGTTVQGSHLYTVSDEGQLYQTDLDGNILNQWNLDGKDLESITTVPGRPGFVYIGVESDEKNGGRPSILEFDINTGKVSRTFNIPEGFPQNEKSGMEALTYNPDTGNFMVGSQSNNQVYSYKLDLDGSSTTVTQQGDPFTAPGGSGDLSDMTYHDGQIYYLFDKKNGDGGATLASADAKNPSILKKHYSNVNIDDQEGIAFSDDFIFLALDSGGLQRMSIKELQ